MLTPNPDDADTAGDIWRPKPKRNKGFWHWPDVAGITWTGVRVPPEPSEQGSTPGRTRGCNRDALENLVVSGPSAVDHQTWVMVVVASVVLTIVSVGHV